MMEFYFDMVMHQQHGSSKPQRIVTPKYTLDLTERTDESIYDDVRAAPGDLITELVNRFKVYGPITNILAFELSLWVSCYHHASRFIATPVITPVQGDMGEDYGLKMLPLRQHLGGLADRFEEVCRKIGGPARLCPTFTCEPGHPTPCFGDSLIFPDLAVESKLHRAISLPFGSSPASVFIKPGSIKTWTKWPNIAPP